MLRENIIVIILLMCITYNLGNENVLNENSLLMVHALFRHGERTTDSFYPNDPHINNTFYPIGKGSLTNRGKQQEYKLGVFLRKRYGQFLGEIYTNDILAVRSTGFVRTRMSALLVLAGLWAPSIEQNWNEKLLWLPIPVDYKPYEEDDLLNPGVCKKRIQVLQKQHEIEDVKRIFITPFKNLTEYIEEHSGKKINSPMELAEFYLILKTEEDTNLTLPNWTKSIYPEPLQSAASLVYSYFNYDSEIRKINAGYFMKKVINDFESKMNGTINKKIFLYSGHESTLGHVLNVLKVKPHISPYASVILVELHKALEQNDYIIKVFYKQGFDSTMLQEIIYPGCDRMCSFQTFKELLKDILPDIPYSESCRLN